MKGVQDPEESKESFVSFGLQNTRLLERMTADPRSALGVTTDRVGPSRRGFLYQVDFGDNLFPLLYSIFIYIQKCVFLYKKSQVGEICPGFNVRRLCSAVTLGRYFHFYTTADFYHLVIYWNLFSIQFT